MGRHQGVAEAEEGCPGEVVDADIWSCVFCRESCGCRVVDELMVGIVESGQSCISLPHEFVGITLYHGLVGLNCIRELDCICSFPTLVVSSRDV